MPNPQKIREISAAGALDERTVRKAYNTPERVRSAAWERVARAALTTGAEPPPRPTMFAGERPSSIPPRDEYDAAERDES